MKKFGILIVALLAFATTAGAQSTYFSFDSLAAYSGFPQTSTVNGLSATLSGTGSSFSIQNAGVLGFTPAGFSGNCIYPNSVFAADLQVQFNLPITHFSIMYAPEEYACDTSAQMRVTGYLNGVFVGTAITTAPTPGTWPTGTLVLDSSKPFNYVVVHYDAPPPTGGDYGPVFMADNMYATVSSTPYAVNDTYIADVNATLSIPASSGVLSNDLQAQGAIVALATGPAHGLLTLLNTGAFTYQPALNYVGTDTFTYTDTVNGVLSNKATVTIKVDPNLSGLGLYPSTLLGDSSATGTIGLSNPAPIAGTVVTLTAIPSTIKVPSTVKISAGSYVGRFNVYVPSVTSITSGTITAHLDTLHIAATITIYPPSPMLSVQVNPSFIVGGTTAYGTATVSPAVPVGKETVYLSTSNSSLAAVSKTMLIYSPAASGVFAITTSPVSADTKVAVGAYCGGVGKSFTFTVRVAPISSMTFDSTSIKGGTSTNATINLGGKAGPTGDVVSLTSSNAKLSVPTTVTVPAGATSVSFPVNSVAVSANTTVWVTAKLGTISKSASLTLTP